jgi:hypothetical protein
MPYTGWRRSHLSLDISLYSYRLQRSSSSDILRKNENTLLNTLNDTPHTPKKRSPTKKRLSINRVKWNIKLLQNCSTKGSDHYQTPFKIFVIFIFIVVPCILKIHLLSHTNKCTNYVIYYLKSVLIIDIKTLSYFHSSYVFRHITCHPQGALMFPAKITGKTICKTWT